MFEACDTARDLFRLEVRCLDDRPPFLDLSLLEHAERNWRLLRVPWNFVPQFFEPLANGSIGQRFHNRAIEPRDDGFRRVLGSPKAMPDRHIETRDAFLIDGWNCRSL